jgi:predicted enzyme related to lactoylglutathione lyase
MDSRAYLTVRAELVVPTRPGGTKAPANPVVRSRKTWYWTVSVVGAERRAARIQGGGGEMPTAIMKIRPEGSRNLSMTKKEYERPIPARDMK